MDALLIFVLLIGLASLQIKAWAGHYEGVSSGYLWLLFSLHFVLSAVYIIYAFSSRSDSFEYYRIASTTTSWGELWNGTGTPFIQFISWPFAYLLGLSYLATMTVFAYLGFWASALFYLATKEQTGELPAVLGQYSYAELVWLLPNLHFWSSSLGKGPISLLGIALYMYGLSRFNKRLHFIIAGLLLSYFVRPHIAFILMGGTAIGVLFTNRGIPWYIKTFIIMASAIAAYYFFGQALAVTQNFDTDFDAFISRRASELGKATSSVDINSYNIFFKLFTFWFRPLFIDAPGFLGVVVSFENTLYLVMLFSILKTALPNFGKLNGWVKAGIFIFLLGSVALAQITGNLGLAMRQKAQLMPLYFILFLRIYEIQLSRRVLPS